jgi:N-acetyltransferase
VVLRPLETGDVPDLARAAAERGASSTYGFIPVGLTETRQYVDDALASRERGLRYPFAIVWNDRVVGSTSYWDFQIWTWPSGSALQRTDVPDAVEIGYTWLGASARRTRCNTEAKYLLLRQAFEAWHVHRVSIRTDERNLRSRQAIERLGAKLDGVIRADKPGIDGAVRNTAHYSVIAVEWPAVKARLETMLDSP